MTHSEWACLGTYFSAAYRGEVPFFAPKGRHYYSPGQRPGDPSKGTSPEGAF